MACTKEMVKLVFNLFYISGVLSFAHIPYFFHNYNDVKCCKPNEILTSIKIKEDISYRCKYDDSKTLYIRAAVFQRDFPKAACVDVLQRIGADKQIVKIDCNGALTSTFTNLTYLPKCCPIHYAYSPLEHRCIESRHPKISKEFINFNLKNGFVIIKPGLGKCRSVIADHEFSSLQEILANVNHNLSFKFFDTTIAYGDYCFDEVHNSSNYVVRICHSTLTGCRKRRSDKSKVKCIRKCCPDGKSYNNTVCENNLFHGFNFLNFNNTKINSPKELFSIIIPEEDCNKFASEEPDEYYVDEKGYIRFTVEDNPPLYYSSFKKSHCFENVKEEGIGIWKMSLYICLTKAEIAKLESEN